MSKSPDAFRTISEVADWLGVQTHVLRFWESKFNQIKPIKRAGGRRYYRPADMLLLGGVKRLLHDDGMTIKGVKKTLREQGIGHVSSLSRPLDQDDDGTMPPNLIASDSPAAAASAEPAGPETDEQIPLDLLPPAETVASPSEQVESLVETAEDTASESASAADTAEIKETVAEDVPDDSAKSAPRARVIELADPPADDDAQANPGVVSQLAKVHELPAPLARQIAPLVQDLRAWYDQASAS